MTSWDFSSSISGGVWPRAIEDSRATASSVDMAMLEKCLSMAAATLGLLSSLGPILLGCLYPTLSAALVALKSLGNSYVNARCFAVSFLPILI